MGALQKTLTTLAYLKHKDGLWLLKVKKQGRCTNSWIQVLYQKKSENYLAIICVHMNRNSQMPCFRGARTKSGVEDWARGGQWLTKCFPGNIFEFKMSSRNRRKWGRLWIFVGKERPKSNLFQWPGTQSDIVLVQVMDYWKRWECKMKRHNKDDKAVYLSADDQF